MTEAADRILTNAEVHTLSAPDEVVDGAVAIRDGTIVRTGSSYDVAFLAGAETETVDLGGRVLLPGFVDAHTHLPIVGRKLVHADLSGAESVADCVDRLQSRADELADEWVLGFGYDESTWGGDYLTRNDLDHVDAAGPVAAVREDLHVVSLDSTALDRLDDDLPENGVHRDGDEPTGVVVEDAATVFYAATEPDATEMRDLVRAAQRYANERGLTGVHDMVRRSEAPRAYRELDLAGELTLRVRLNYWADHLDALVETGMRTNHGSDFVRTGAIKTFSDGSIGGRTAKLSRAYDDGSGTGEWVVAPDELRDLVDRADAAGFQLAVHAIGDVAVDEALDAFEDCPAPGASRHRIEHLELASDEAVERLATLGVVASMQPNFHRWAGPSGLYDARLGDRRPDTNRLGLLADAGAPVAFGSDCMPLDPLLGVHHAVNGPTESQSLGVTDALRAYTLGAAYAGFDEDNTGTIEVGKRADLVALERSPWEVTDVAGIDVALTVVDGEIVYADLD